MLKKVLAILLLVLVSVINVRAAEPGEYIVGPALPKKVTGIGKVFERANLFLRFSPDSKAGYWRKLVDRRLTELVAVVEENNLDMFEETTSRYSTYVGRYSDYILAKNLDNQKEITRKMFAKHLEILEPLRDKYEFESAWWLLLQHDINTIRIFSDKL